jgi:hypothetical protein
MNWGKKKIAAVSGFIMGAFMMAAGSVAGAQETDVSVKDTFAEKCGIVETRGQLHQCYMYTAEQLSEYQLQIKEVVNQDKELLEPVYQEYFAAEECRTHSYLDVDIFMDMLNAILLNSDGQEPINAELSNTARQYFSSGNTCLAKGSDVLEKHEALKTLAEGYRDLSDKMGQVSGRLPIPKPQS